MNFLSAAARSQSLYQLRGINYNRNVKSQSVLILHFLSSHFSQIGSVTSDQLIFSNEHRNNVFKYEANLLHCTILIFVYMYFKVFLCI